MKTLQLAMTKCWCLSYQGLRGVARLQSVVCCHYHTVHVDRLSVQRSGDRQLTLSDPNITMSHTIGIGKQVSTLEVAGNNRIVRR